MLENYFKELLEKHNRVIIPDFGAFLVKDTGDDRNISNTTFSPFLRYNDGLVENFLSEKEKLTKSDASIKVREYVEKLKSRVESGENVLLPGLGYFSQDTRGAIQFTVDILGETPIPSTKSKPADKPIELSKEKENLVPTKEQPVVEKQEKQITKKTIAKQSPTKRKPKKEVESIAPVKEEKIATSTSATEPTIPKSAQEEIEITSTNENKPMPPKISSKKKTTKSNSGRNWLILVFSLIILLAIAVWQYDNLVTIFGPSANSAPMIDNTTSSVVDTTNKDTTKAMTAPGIKTASNTKQQPVYVKPVIDNPDNKFFVVVGSFTSKANALSMKATLEAKGYQPIVMQRNNGLNSVVISGHKTKEEAKLSLESYKKKNGSGWIMAR